MRLSSLKQLTVPVAIASTVFTVGLSSHLPAAQGQTVAEIPTVTVNPTNTALTLSWPNGERYPIEIQDWTVTLLASFDCVNYDFVVQRDVSARRILGTPAVNPQTGNIAVPVLLEECADVQKSAVFIIDPQTDQSHALHLLQVPGDLPFPNEFSTSYALSSINGVHYWNETLLVSHGDVSGAAAMLIFSLANTSVGDYAGCVVTRPGEGAISLCPGR